jgi:hypothetical protein
VGGDTLHFVSEVYHEDATFRTLAIGLFFTGGASWADDQPDAKIMLDKAMKEMGAEAKLAKLSSVSGKAHITISENGKEIVVDLDGHWQGLNQYRADLDVQEGGNNFMGMVTRPTSYLPSRTLTAINSPCAKRLQDKLIWCDYLHRRKTIDCGLH